MTLAKSFWGFINKGKWDIGFEDAESQVKSYSNALSAGTTASEFFADKNNAVSKGFKEYVKSVKDGAVTTEGFIEFTKKASKGTSLLATSIKGLLVSLAFKGLSWFYQEIINKNERLRESVKELDEQYNSSSQNISDNLSSVQNLELEFNRLSVGVDDFGQNVSLTSDQFDRYKSICKQLVAINPSLIKAYDSEGEAIIEKNNAIEKSISLLKDQQRLENASYTSDENFASKVAVFQMDFQNALDRIQQAKSLDLTAFGGENYGTIIGNLSNDIESAMQEFNSKSAAYLGDLPIELQEKYDAILSARDKFIELFGDPQKGLQVRDDWSKAIWDNESNALDTISLISNYLNKAGIDTKELNGLSEAIYQSSLKIQQAQDEFDLTNRSAIDYAQTFATTLSSFKYLSSQQQSIVNSILGNIDYNEILQGEKPEQAASIIKSKVMSWIDVIATDKEFSKVVSNLFSIDASKVNYDEYRRRVDSIAARLSDESKIALGISIKLDDGEIVDEVDNIYNNITTRLLERFAGTERGRYHEIEERITKMVNSMSIDQLKTLFDLDLSDINTLEDVMNAVLGKTGQFDLKSYTDDLKKLQEKLDKVSDALGKLSDKSLKAKDVVALLEDFPELGEYVTDLTDEGFGRLTEGLTELARSKPQALIDSLNKLKETIGGDTTELERAIELIEKMRDEALSLSKDGLIDYGKTKLQNLIDELERANKLLERQKEDLEKVTEKYEKAQKAINTVLEDKIDKLKEDQNAVKEYYNDQIDLLKEEKDTRQKNVDLLEKQQELEKAKNNKVRVYSAARGWTVQSDSAAVAKAENELKAAEAEKKIEDLENKRDKADKQFDKKIDAIEKYQNKWEKAVQNSADALADKDAAKELLGEDWQKLIDKFDTSAISTFKDAYTAKAVELFKVNQDIKTNTEDITKLTRGIENIDNLVADPEKGLSSAWDLLNNSNLNVSNIDTNLDYFTGWIKRMYGDPSLEGYETEQDKQKIAGEAASKMIAGGLMGGIDFEKAEKVVNMTPGMGLGLNTIPQNLHPISVRNVHQGNFSPNIVNNFTANKIDENAIMNWWDSLISNEYSKFVSGQK